MARGWIGVDLDGTLAHYDYGSSSATWDGSVGDPIPAMVERVRRWLEEGRDVRILTARVARKHGIIETTQQRATIQRWCEKHIGRVLQVTSEKDCDMIELWDDRAVQVIPNTGQPSCPSTRGLH
jgi:hypothetical protein